MVLVAKKYTSFVAAIGIVFAVVIVSFVVALTQAQMSNISAQGGGGAGEGGEPTTGGCSGGCADPASQNGYGWYSFDSNGSGPRDFANGERWSDVSDLCRRTGNDRVMTWLALRGTGGPSNARVYNYESDWGGTYMGNQGGRWVPTNTAEAMYNSIDDSFKRDLTWGYNVGWFCYNERKEWTINGQSYIMNNGGSRQQGWDALEAKPGDRLTWDHDLRNNPTSENMDRNVSVNIDYEDFLLSNGNSLGLNPQSAGSHRGNTNILFFTNYGGGHTVTQSDVGERLCRRVAWQDKAWNDTNWGHSTWACARIPYDYSLTPNITAPSNGGNRESDQGPISVRGSIQNSGPTKSRPDINWRITQIEYAPSVKSIAKSGGGDGSAVCSFFTGYKSGECNELNSGTDAGFSKDQTKTDFTATGDLTDKPLGTQICFVLSISPYQEGQSGWRHSALSCITINKKPKVQVLGGDLWVGRGTNGSGTPYSSEILTSVTSTKRNPQTVAAPPSAFSGLYKTGVQNNNTTTLAANAPDQHWIIDRVYRQGGRTGSTCQQMVTGSASSSTITPIPKESYTGSTPLYARTIYQKDGYAGVYATNALNVTGNPVGKSVANLSGSGVWNRVSKSGMPAKWIGQNQYGQNYSSASCEDPTLGNIGGDDANLSTEANVYVFKLAKNFTIASNMGIDLNTVQLHIEGGVDNEMRFYVNGKPVSGWLRPGWTTTSTATSEVTGNVFKYSNSLEIHVRSTYSHTGILIEKIQATAQRVRSDDATYGSWGEYAVVGPSRIKGMASAAGYSGGTDESSYCALSLLTFANRNTAGTCNEERMGGYKISESRPAQALLSDMSTRPSTTISGSSYDISPSPSSTPANRVYKTNRDIELSATQPVKKGQWAVISAPGRTVTITGNIRYTNTITRSGSETPAQLATKLPQVVIIADTIVINSGVTQVDAWLVASNTVKTCNVDRASDLNGGVCRDRLTVNGPVIADRLLLYRTAGAERGNASGDPAEVFNLRPDAYLWATGMQNESVRIRTVQSSELPPRF
jgi:hypothetical protein